MNIVDNLNCIVIYQSDIKFEKIENGLYNLSVCGIDYGTNYEILLRYNGNDYIKRNLSTLKGNNDLLGSLKRCLTYCLLKHDEGDFYGSYEIHLMYLDKNTNKKTYINIFVYDIYEGYISVNSGLKENLNFSKFNSVNTNIAYDLIGEIVFDKDGRYFKCVDSVCADSSIALLLKDSIPAKRKRKSNVAISDKRKAKILQIQSNEKVLKEKELLIKSKFGLSGISHVKSYKFEEVSSFYDYINECLDDIYKTVNLRYVDKLKYIKLNKTKSFGSYHHSSYSITINNVVLNSFDKCTFYHEFGHHLYDCLYSNNIKKNLIKEFISEIRRMETITKIRDKKKYYNDLNNCKDSNVYYSLSYYNYLLSETEIFARIFEYYLSSLYGMKSQTITNSIWFFTDEECLLFKKYLSKLGLLN